MSLINYLRNFSCSRVDEYPVLRDMVWTGFLTAKRIVFDVICVSLPGGYYMVFLSAQCGEVQ